MSQACARSAVPGLQLRIETCIGRATTGSMTRRAHRGGSSTVASVGATTSAIVDRWAYKVLIGEGASSVYNAKSLSKTATEYICIPDLIASLCRKENKCYLYNLGSRLSAPGSRLLGFRTTMIFAVMGVIQHRSARQGFTVQREGWSRRGYIYIYIYIYIYCGHPLTSLPIPTNPSRGRQWEKPPTPPVVHDLAYKPAKRAKVSS